MRSPELVHVNEIVFVGDLFKIGRWRLPVEHPHFTNSGPARHYLVVFPRTATWIQHAGTAAFPSDPNNVTFYNRHQEYTRRPIAPAGDCCDYYAIDPALLREVVALWRPRAADRDTRVVDVSHGPSDAASYLTQRHVYRHVRREAKPDALLVEEAMLGVVLRLFEMAYSGASLHPERQRDIVEHTRELIARTYHAPWTISELAARSGISAFRLCRLFRAQTGLTIHAYRNQLRLRAALDRVLDPRADLSQVALDLGYCSHSHFTAAFRQLYGATPTAVRRRGRFSVV